MLPADYFLTRVPTFPVKSGKGTPSYRVSTLCPAISHGWLGVGAVGSFPLPSDRWLWCLVAFDLC